MAAEAGVTLDVTAVIGAQEYMLSHNHRRRPRDPFARECFIGVVQTLIFNTAVFVAHPTSTAPRADDFGDKPTLLRRLLAHGLIRPLRLTGDQDRVAADEEGHMLRLLGTEGPMVLRDYIELTRFCDDSTGAPSIADQIKAWCVFQQRDVRRHHEVRVPTVDGVEDDDFGEWARATAVSFRGRVREIAPTGDEAYVLAFLTRGLKYQSRSVAGGTSYQAHPARRDFMVLFGFAEPDAGRERVHDIVKIVRGIRDALIDSAAEQVQPRLSLLEFELPLLGGRLWSPGEAARRPDDQWIDLIVDRIADYRSRAGELRAAISACVFDEEHARLSRDFDEVKFHLLERLGLRDVELSAVERDLVRAASVVESAPGVPKVGGVWLGARSARKRLSFKGTPYQQFLYREFLDAWRRTAR